MDTYISVSVTYVFQQITGFAQGLVSGWAVCVKWRTLQTNLELHSQLSLWRLP